MIWHILNFNILLKFSLVRRQYATLSKFTPNMCAQSNQNNYHMLNKTNTVKKSTPARIFLHRSITLTGLTLFKKILQFCLKASMCFISATSITPELLGIFCMTLQLKSQHLPFWSCRKITTKLWSDFWKIHGNAMREGYNLVSQHMRHLVTKL